ncbi:MAG: hypothetical protein R3F55_11455 [Alphaproteobacteria bacterium]
MLGIEPARTRWGTRLALVAAVGAVMWAYGPSPDSLKRDIAVGPTADDLRHDIYGGSRPETVADVGAILSILETHPWVCVDPAVDGSCGRLEQLSAESPGALTATTQVVMSWHGMTAFVEGTVAQRVTDIGFCAPARAGFENVTVDGPAALEDRIAEQMDFLADVYDEAGELLCTLYAPPQYDAASDSFASFQYDALDSGFATEPLPVRFLAAPPALRPREL